MDFYNMLAQVDNTSNSPSISATIESVPLDDSYLPVPHFCFPLSLIIILFVAFIIYALRTNKKEVYDYESIISAFLGLAISGILWIFKWSGTTQLWFIFVCMTLYILFIIKLAKRRFQSKSSPLTNEIKKNKNLMEKISTLESNIDHYYQFLGVHLDNYLNEIYSYFYSENQSKSWFFGYKRVSVYHCNHDNGLILNLCRVSENVSHKTPSNPVVEESETSYVRELCFNHLSSNAFGKIWKLSPTWAEKNPRSRASKEIKYILAFKYNVQKNHISALLLFEFEHLPPLVHRHMENINKAFDENRVSKDSIKEFIKSVKNNGDRKFSKKGRNFHSLDVKESDIAFEPEVYEPPSSKDST